MPSIFTSTKFFFNRPIDHQSTSNDRLKPVMTTGLVNMHIDRSIANLDDESRLTLTYFMARSNLIPNALIMGKS